MSKTRDGYVEIKVDDIETPESIIPKEGEEVIVDLEDITTEPEPEKKEELETKQEDEKEETSKEKEKPTTKKKASKKKEETDKKPSRAKKRIKQLASEKNDLQQQLEKEREEREALERQLEQGNKSSKETVKTTLENSLNTMTISLKEAIENGDADDIVRLQDEITTAKMQLAAVSSELSKIEANEKNQPKKVSPKKQQTQQDIPEKALDWIEDHPQFDPRNKQFDELFHVMAMTVNNQLINEGFDYDSDEFYDELNERLSPRFPEIFGIEEQNGVNYTQDDENASEKDADEESEDEDDSRQVEQTVSGASRTPPHKKGKKSSGSKQIVLDPETVRRSERMGLKIDRIARRVAHNETNRRDDGYVSIEIPSKK